MLFALCSADSDFSASYLALIMPRLCNVDVCTLCSADMDFNAGVLSINFVCLCNLDMCVLSAQLMLVLMQVF